jgi:hypothetical protein
MQISRRRVVVSLVIAVAIAGFSGAALALAGEEPRLETVLKGTLAVSTPGGPTIHGVEPLTEPKKLRSGEVVVRSNGKIEVAVRGLVKSPGNELGGVTSIYAALYCAGKESPVARTPDEALGAAGRAKIDTIISLPSTCMSPTVLLHPSNNDGHYVAAYGFGE